MPTGAPRGHAFQSSRRSLLRAVGRQQGRPTCGRRWFGPTSPSGKAQRSSARRCLPRGWRTTVGATWLERALPALGRCSAGTRQRKGMCGVASSPTRGCSGDGIEIFLQVPRGDRCEPTASVWRSSRRTGSEPWSAAQPSGSPPPLAIETGICHPLWQATLIARGDFGARR